MKPIYRCKHQEVEITGYDDSGRVVQCCYCGEVFTDDQYELYLEQRELESMVNNVCGIKGKRVC